MNDLQKKFMDTRKDFDYDTEYAVLNEYGDLFECESMTEAINIQKNNRDSIILQRSVSPWNLP